MPCKQLAFLNSCTAFDNIRNNWPDFSFYFYHSLADMCNIMERRKHFRLHLNLPLEIELISENKSVNRVSANVSAGGMFFHGKQDDRFRAGQRFRVTMSAPATSGKAFENHSIAGEGEILRVARTSKENDKLIACKFDKPLKFVNP